MREASVTQMERMEKSLESVTKNFATLRTGRANPAMLDRVKVRPRLNSCRAAVPKHSVKQQACVCHSSCSQDHAVAALDHSPLIVSGCCAVYKHRWSCLMELCVYTTGCFCVYIQVHSRQCFNCFMQVDYYGTLAPLKTIAGISAPESTMLVVQPYDKTAMQAIEKAITQSDIGATPNSDGNLIRIKLPALTAVSCQSSVPSVSL